MLKIQDHFILKHCENGMFISKDFDQNDPMTMYTNVPGDAMRFSDDQGILRFIGSQNFSLNQHAKIQRYFKNNVNLVLVKL